MFQVGELHPEIECPDCGSQMRLRDSSYGLFWGCTSYPWCRGIHNAREGTGEPCGVPTTMAGRAARRKAHAAFDPIWKSGRMTRPEAYQWLQRELGLTARQCHIGAFDEKMCARVIEACGKLEECNA